MKRITVSRMLKKRLSESKRAYDASYEYEDLVNVLGGDNSQEIAFRNVMKKDIADCETALSALKSR
jgi:hypothetical protein